MIIDAAHAPCDYSEKSMRRALKKAEDRAVQEKACRFFCDRIARLYGIVLSDGEDGIYAARGSESWLVYRPVEWDRRWYELQGVVSTSKDHLGLLSTRCQ